MRLRYFLLGLLAGVVFSMLLLFILPLSSGEDAVAILPTTQAQSTEMVNGIIEENEGKININTATIDEFDLLPGIGPVKAAAIIKFRDQYGSFKSVDELLYISGISEAVFLIIVDLIYVK